MFANRISKIFIVLFAFAVALVTVSFAASSGSVPSIDRSYDRIEQERIERLIPHTTINASDDQIEKLRSNRHSTPFSAEPSYDLLDQLRIERWFEATADRSSDQVEDLRLQRTNK